MKERDEFIPSFRLLAEMIELIDEIAFKIFLRKKKLKVKFARAPDPSSKKTIAMHVPAERSTDSKEHYVVFTFFSEEEIREAAEKSNRSQAEFLLSTAVHEVRHRVQYHFPSMILFSEDDQKRVKDPLIKTIIEGILRVLENSETKREIWFLFSESYADPRAAIRKEFDAIVIETIATLLWRKMTAEDELPEKKFKRIGNLVIKDARFFEQHTLEELTTE